MQWVNIYECKGNLKFIRRSNKKINRALDDFLIYPYSLCVKLEVDVREFNKLHLSHLLLLQQSFDFQNYILQFQSQIQNYTLKDHNTLYP